MTPQELGDEFDLNRALEIGALPLVLDAASPVETLRSYVQLYLREEIKGEALVRNLPAFEARLRARERKHPKLYWVDPGVVRAAKGVSGPVVAEEAGVLLEGWIHTLLRTCMSERELADEIAYWAPAESKQREVDFVLRRGSELCALEVKATRRPQPQHMAGLRAIAELPGLRRRVLVHRGDRATRTEDGIDAWPVATLLEALESDGLWP